MRVSGPAETALNVSNELTIAAWVYPEDHETTTADMILNKEGEYELAIFPDGTLRYAIANEVYGWAWQNSAVIIPANQWSHIGFTYSAEDGVIIFYVNGVEVRRSESLSGSIGDTEPGLNELHIGGRQFGTTEHFMGMIDEVYIFDQVVGPENIATLAAVPGAGACTVPGSHATIQAAINDRICAEISIGEGSFVENLELNREVTLTGQGADKTIIDGNRAGRVMTVLHGSQVVVESLTITNGFLQGAKGGTGGFQTGRPVWGGGIYNRGQLTLRKVDVTENHLIGGEGGDGASGAQGATGGQGSKGSAAVCVFLADCHTPAGNGGTGGRGGTGVQGNPGTVGGDAGGAGIYNQGELLIENSRIVNNSAIGGRGGQGGPGGKGGTGGRGGTGGDPSYNGCVSIHGGDGGRGGTGGRGGNGGQGGQGGYAYGGGIDSSGVLTVTTSLIENNSTTFGEGGPSGAAGAPGNRGSGGTKGGNGATSLNGCSGTITPIGSAPVNGPAGSLGSPGSIGQVGPQGGAYGGGVHNNVGEAFVEDSTIKTNSAQHGGGVAATGSIQSISRSLIWGNSALVQGGGIYGSISKLENLTITENEAQQGGGIYSKNGIENLSFSTFVNNVATAQDSGSAIHVGDGRKIEVSAVIVAGTAETGPNCVGETITNDRLFNIETGSSCGFALSNTDPLLGPLADNGGPTLTYALLDGSPAIDGVYDRALTPEFGPCTVTTEDQRGISRVEVVTPFSDCDIGAYEVDSELLYTYASPWERYFADAATKFEVGNEFRTTELTRPSDQNGQITTIQNIREDYNSHNEGRLFWRYCSDYDTLQAGEGCTPLDQTRIDMLEASKSYDIHNILAQAKRDFAAIYLGPDRDVTVTFDDETRTENLQALAAEGLLKTVLELANIHHVYGNEFMVDGLRSSFGDPGQSGPDIIQAEIDKLTEAQQQFRFVSTLFLGMALEPLDETGLLYVTDYMAAADFETFAIASEREVAALLEIAERQRLWAEDDADIAATLDLLDEGYANQLTQALTFAAAMQGVDDPATESNEAQAAFLAHGGWQLIDNLERIVQLTETIRTENNLLGYDPSYVPLAAYEDLYEQMTTTTGGGILADLREKEQAARDAERAFDNNASVLNDPTGPLYQIQQEFNRELESLCGATNGDDFLICNGGKMKVNYSDLERANRVVALAWQRASNIPKLIDIEENRSAQVIMQINNAAVEINALQLSIAKLEGYQKVTTVSQTTEVWAEGSDPNDPTSGAYWLDWTKDQGSCILAGATAGALGDGCQGNIDGIFSGIGTLFGIEDKPTKIETVDEVWNPNEEEIAKLEGVQQLREAERDARIEGVNSAAEVQRLLLQQSDLLIEYEIALEELNRVIAERNLLVEQHRRTLNERKRVSADYLEYVYNPAYRIIRDDTALEAELAFERAKQYAYLTARALDYKLLGAIDPNNDYRSLIPYEDLYVARNARHISDFLQALEDINIGLPTPQRTPQTISIAEDIMGLTDERLQGLLPYTPDLETDYWPTDMPACVTSVINSVDTLRLCKFQTWLRGGLTTNSLITGDDTNQTEMLIFNFGTSIDLIDEARVYWNQTIAPLGSSAQGCSSNSQCQGMALDIETDQTNFSSDSVKVRVTHGGANNYRRQIGPGRNDLELVQYRPGRTAIVGQTTPYGFPAEGTTTTVIDAHINGSGGLSSGFLAGLSGATTDWRLEINLSTGNAQQLDVTQIEDIVLKIDMLAYPVQGVSVRELEARSAVRMAEFNGQSVAPEIAADVAAFDAAQAADLASSRSFVEPIRIERDFNSDQALPPIGGFYDGSLFVNGPINLGIVDLGLTLSETDGELNGELCDSCTPLFDEAVALTGQFMPSATTTDTFKVETSYLDLQNGVTVTHTILLEGIVTDQGDFLEGVYTDIVTGLAPEPVEMSGTFLLARRAQEVYTNEAVAPNEAPTAQDDTATAVSGRSAAINVRANDSDPNGDVLIISSVGQPSHGTAEISGGVILYTSNIGYVGSDALTYTISDGRGGKATATVVIDVVEGGIVAGDQFLFLPMIRR